MGMMSCQRVNFILNIQLCNAKKAQFNQQII